MGSALQFCTLGLRGDFLEGAFNLLQMQSQRIVTEKGTSLWQVGVCADVGGQRVLCVVLGVFPSHRQANSKDKAQ